MPPPPNSSRAALPAAVSTLVAGLVDGPVVPATVVAGHRFALYLDVAGGVLPVVTSDAVALPTALRLAVPAGSVEWGVAAGGVVPVGRGRMVLPTFDVVAARTWRPARVRRTSRGECASGGRGDRVRTHREKGAVVGLLAEAAGAGCDAWLLDALDSLAPLTPLTPLASLTQLAAPVGGSCVEATRGLLGRGRGLTPSGDDALAGALLVAHAQGSRTGLADAVRARLHLTTSVSAALLRSAADGYAARDVVTLVDAAVAGDPDAVARSLPAVLAMGHTSGHDLVAGVRAALTERPGRADHRDHLAHCERAAHPDQPDLPGQHAHPIDRPLTTPTGRSAA